MAKDDPLEVTALQKDLGERLSIHWDSFTSPPERTTAEPRGEGEKSAIAARPKLKTNG
jgi:hypothetical protein